VLALVLAVASAAGLVALGATRPARLRSIYERRVRALSELLAAGRLTLDQADDGAVLARRLGLSDLSEKFKADAARLKRRGREV
jgi:hypothetical protein